MLALFPLSRSIIVLLHQRMHEHFYTERTNMIRLIHEWTNHSKANLSGVL